MNKDILFSFNIIFDIEYGLYKHIMKEYDDTYFSFKFKDNDYLKNVIMFRDNPNPLSKICTEKTKDNIDKLYEDIMKSEYDNILDNIIVTDLIIFIRQIEKTNRLHPVVLCKNIKEEQLCIKYNLTPLLCTEKIDWEKFSNNYDVMYFRYFEEVDLLKIQGKNIYFSNTIYNVINKDKLLSINNEIRFIDLYRLAKPV